MTMLSRLAIVALVAAVAKEVNYEKPEISH